MSDVQALRETHGDISDIPRADVERIREGFDAAYQRAEQIRRGEREPL